MGNLIYTKEATAPLKLCSDFYEAESIYSDVDINKRFLQLKANVCDLNPALVTKCITGTEQDFIMLMNRARDFINATFAGIDDEEKKLSKAELKELQRKRLNEARKRMAEKYGDDYTEE